MIGSKYHIKLDGESYRLASLGDSATLLSESYEPIRAPNSSTVVGDEDNKVNVRQDVLVWRWTDWSQGEGQYKLKTNALDGFYQGQQLDSWSIGGVLKLGPAAHAEDSSPTLDDESVVVVRYDSGAGELVLIDEQSLYVWEGTAWGSATAITGISAGGVFNAV